MINQKCYLKYQSSTKKADLSKSIIANIKDGSMSEILGQLKNSTESLVMKEGEDAHLISTLGSNLKRTDFSSIDFGKCEEKIRNEYNIPDYEELILYEVEHSVDKFNIPILEYVLFTEDGKTQLDLGKCDNMKVQYYIPVSVDENELDKHDPSSDFYNDKCNKHSTEDGVDMTLYERKNNFNNNNMALCEKGCVYKGFDSETKKVECDCNIKSDMNYYSDGIIQDDLLDKIDSQKSASNLEVTQCINNVFDSPKKLISNSGFVALLIIIFIFLIIFIIFCIKGKQLYVNKIDEVIYNKFDKQSVSINKIKRKNKKSTTVKDKVKDDKIKTEKGKTIVEEKHIKKKIKNKKFKTKKFKKDRKAKRSMSVSYSKKSSRINIIKNIGDLNLENNNIDYIKGKEIPTKEDNSNSNSNNELEEPPDNQNDYELNTLEYSQAIKYDKRSCCDYYSSQLKNKQLFLFTFCSFNDYNSGIIKKFIFFLSFAIHFAISALFFNDENMHQIYQDEGKYNISYQIPKILISAVSSTAFLRIMLETLILTDRNVLKVKRQPTRQLAESMRLRVLKCINIKFAIFFIINFILLVLFWFYLTCLTDTYENTQIYIIENTFIGFGISLFYPFIWNIIPSLLRMMALDTKNGDRKCLYMVSKICQFI